MKKPIAALVIVLSVFSIIALAGCGSSGGGTATTTTSVSTASTTSTTTTTLASNPTARSIGQSAIVANSAILGVSNIGTAVGDASGTTGDPTQTFGRVQMQNVSANMIPVAPPASFFAVRDSSWDGFVNVESLHTGEVVSLRFSTMAGAAIDGALLSSMPQKQIADATGINWDNLVSPETISWVSGFTAWLSPGPDYHKYQNIASLWDYILWASVLPKVQIYAQSIATAHGVGTIPPLSTPDTTIPDNLIGGFQGTVTREVSATNYGVNLAIIGTMEYNTSIIPSHEVPASLAGEGIVTLPDSTEVVIPGMNLGFQTNVHGGVVPSTGTVTWILTKEGNTWSGTLTLNGADRTASGTIDKDGVLDGTLYLDAIGGAIVTVEGQTINVTAPQ